MSSDEQTVTQAGVHMTGRVKWFNNKVGYGFITITDGDNVGSDIFAHHSAINVENQQYKYLVQGEYVEFELIKTTNEKHEYQASGICGIKGGKLMCETRNEVRQARSDYRNSSRTTAQTEQTQSQPQYQTRGQRSQRTQRPRHYARSDMEQSQYQSQSMPRQRRHYSRPSDYQYSQGDEQQQDWTVVSRRPKVYRPRQQRQTQQS